MKTICKYFPTVLLLFLFTILVCGQDEDSKLINELLIADLELQDDCEKLANVMKLSLIQNSFKERIDALHAHGKFLKTLSENLKLFDDIPYDVQKNWTTLVKSGDTILFNEDWETLVSYYTGNEELMHTTRVQCVDDEQKCPLIKNGYEKMLENVKSETILKKGWGAWQTLLTLRKSNFPNVLNLIQKAALQNDQSDARSYWEMLVEQENAYETADALWKEIEPLYLKLHDFVKARIFKLYNIQNDSSAIPVYLLGSNFGYDWSYVADTVLPHPLIHYKAKSYLAQKSVKDVYKLAEDLTQQMSLGKLGEGFWRNSLFNVTFCENHVLSFCTQEHAELLTCDKTSWVVYLDSFEVAVDVALRNTNYLTLSRSNLRYSVIDEAIKTLGSVLAIKNMRHNGVVDRHLLLPNAEDESNKMTELLLIALRVLPRLPFYLLADKWRLHILEKNEFHHMENSWWEFRKQFQGVKGISNQEFDFLGEPFIISNRPYLSKFFGTVLAFQLLASIQLSMMDPNDNIALHIGNDENFLNMIHERLVDDWQNLISNYYSISYLSANSLLDYFQPLEYYLESASLVQEKIPTEAPKIRTTMPIKSEKIQEVVVRDSKKNNTPIQEVVDENAHPKHIHPIVIDNPNPIMEKLTMYVGLGLLGAVAAVLCFVIVSKKMKKKRNKDNRSFES